MNYEVYGGFPIPRNSFSMVSRTRADKQKFWAEVEKTDPDLPDACGCYVFVIRNRAWYVGMAERQSFKQECFAIHKIIQYNEALAQVNGKPCLILLPKVTPGGRFASPTQRGHRDVRLLENLLIGSALSRNPELQNVKGTKLLREMNVPGFLNSRQGQGRALSVQALRQAVGRSKSRSLHPK